MWSASGQGGETVVSVGLAKVWLTLGGIRSRQAISHLTVQRKTMLHNTHSSASSTSIKKDGRQFVNVAQMSTAL